MAEPSEYLPPGRVLVAFESDTLDWNTSPWTRLDNLDGVRVSSYTIDRGRQTELDRTEPGRATVELWDREGALDPTNAAGDFYGFLEPLRQIALRRRNPMTDTWHTRFRGFIEDFDYEYDPSQRVNRLTLTLVDIFDVLAAIEMMPNTFGDPGSAPADSKAEVWFDNANMDVRIVQILTNAGILEDWYVVFSGNVELQETVYSPAETALDAIQEAADAEWPGIGNVFPDRFGRLAVHGRVAKFDPAAVLGTATPGQWDFHDWHVGDGAAVLDDPSQRAHLRRFGFSKGVSKIINSAIATPMRRNVPLTEAETLGQIVVDDTSTGKYGIRSWSAQNLITNRGLLDDSSDLVETKRFASYYVSNYAIPRERATALQFRPMEPGWAGAGRTWALLTLADISDRVFITVAGANGVGGFDEEPYYIEGVHEEARAGHPDYDDVTMTLDISPTALYLENPWEGL